MKAIWKYSLGMTDKQTIEMPAGAEILCVQEQLKRPCVWAAVESTAPMESRTFFIVGTGHELPDFNAKYIGTWQEQNGYLVWHLFEKIA